MMAEDVGLIIEINNKQPLELVSFAGSMISLGDEYVRFLSAHYQDASAGDVKLYVKEMRKGSIIAELIASSPYALPLIENATTLIEYAKFLKQGYDWLMGKSDQKPEPLGKSNLSDLINIVEPVASDSHGQMVFISCSNMQVHNTFTIDHSDARQVQASGRRKLAQLKTVQPLLPRSGMHHQVVMYWAQARNRLDSKAGDQAYIESLYSRPVKVMFENEQLKSRMLYDEPYPFKKAFVVDVAVETVEGKPVRYKVTELHEVIEQSSDDEVFDAQTGLYLPDKARSK